MRTGLFLLSILFVSCGAKKTPSEHSMSTGAVNDGGINFTIKDLDGNDVQLASYRGKTVLLNIWATWCGPCKKEIPDLNTIHRDYSGKDVVVIGVLLESGTMEEAKKAVMEDFKIDYPTWYGDMQFARQFEVIGFPLTVIIDKEGKIRNKLLGQQTREIFVNALRKAGV